MMCQKCIKHWNRLWNKQFFFLKAFLIFVLCSYFLLSTKQYFSVHSLVCSGGRRAGGYFAIICHWDDCAVISWHFYILLFLLWLRESSITMGFHYDASAHLCLSQVICDSWWMLCLRGLKKCRKHSRNLKNLRAPVYLKIYFLYHFYIIVLCL